METYSLLQLSLDQTIERAALEVATDAVRGITRMDCPRILRERSGILVSGLERDDALAFQAALNGHHFPTTIVSDEHLPLLHESFQIQRIEHRHPTSSTSGQRRRTCCPPYALASASRRACPSSSTGKSRASIPHT